MLQHTDRNNALHDISNTLVERSNKRTMLRRSTGLLNLDEASLGSPGAPKGPFFRRENSLKRPFQATTDGAPNSPFGFKDSFKDTFEFPKPRTLNLPREDDNSGGSPVGNNCNNTFQMKRRDSMDNVFGVPSSNTSSPEELRYGDVSQFSSGPFSLYVNRTSPSPSPAKSGVHYLHNSDSANNNNNNNNSASLHTLTHVLENTPEGRVSKPKNPALMAVAASDYNTPDSYKFVKPLQTAFMSTGLLSKRNRMKTHQFDDRRPPDTPCKKPGGVGVFSSLIPGTTSSNSTPGGFAQYASVHTSANSSPLHSMYENREGNRRSKLGLRDSLLRFSVDFGNSSTALHDMESPETPTKEAFHRHSTSNSPSGIGRGASPSQQQQQPLPLPLSIPVATRQQSDSSTATVTAKDKNMLSSPNQRRWSLAQSSSSSSSPSAHVSSSPHPDVIMQSSDSMEEDGIFVRQPALPRTPAKPPKHSSIPPVVSFDKDETDPVLTERFERIQLVGRGEFSTVYSISTRGGNSDRYAVKRTKYPFMGPKARSRRLEEVEILKNLTESNSDAEGKESVLTLIDAWEANDHLYIMTMYCENGSLDTFLSERGNFSRLDEWRVWKILVEITLGLRFIHNEGYLHLDIKPANIFITFEGTLKIGDFGMATKYPAPKGIEREGDREYIAPEVLSRQQYDKPADIFSLGIMMLEIAANIVLPDNGVHWQKLRSGDLTDAGRLSSGDLCVDEFYASDEDILSPPAMPPSSMPSSIPSSVPSQASEGGGYSGLQGRIPPWAPKFMIDDSGALDQVVKWMLDPAAEKRPTAADLLLTPEVKLVDERRKTGAVIYEGDYGPSPDDEEMLREDWRRE